MADDRPPGRRRRGPLVVVAALVVALVAGGLWGGLRWQAARARETLGRGFDAVHGAFLTGECRTAAARYQALDRPASIPARNRTARRELAGCTALERARASTGSAGDRAVAYLDVLRSGLPDPLRAVARDELAGVLSATGSSLASEELCRRNDELESGLLSPADRARALPILLYRCGTAGGIPAQAAEYYLHQLVTDYPRSPVAVQGARSLASLIIAADPESERRAFAGVVEIDRNPSLEPLAELLVYNEGPRELEVAALGRDANVGSVPGCSTCRPYYGPDVEVTCSFTGPPLQLLLRAGDYRMAVRYAEAPARSGLLTLRAGRVYRTCIWAVGSIS